MSTNLKRHSRLSGVQKAYLEGMDSVYRGKRNHYPVNSTRAKAFQSGRNCEFAAMHNSYEYSYG